MDLTQVRLGYREVLSNLCVVQSVGKMIDLVLPLDPCFS